MGETFPFPIPFPVFFFFLSPLPHDVTSIQALLFPQLALPEVLVPHETHQGRLPAIHDPIPLLHANMMVTKIAKTIKQINILNK